MFVVFEKKVLGGYRTPQDAALALAHGAELVLPFGADPATLRISPNLREWIKPG